MAKKKNNSFLPKLAMVVVFVLAVIYTVYHLISLFADDEVKTIVSGVTTHSVTVGGTGYVFRDESLLESDNSGPVDYLVGNGEKVAMEQRIADVYEGNGALARKFIRVLDEQIELLQKSQIGAEPVDLAILRQEASEVYYKLVELLATGEVGELDTQIEKMMVTLNRISALTDEEMSVAQALDELIEYRARLFSGDSQTVRAFSSGYFYYTADGYENRFTLNAADELTPERFDALAGFVEDNRGSVSGKVFGKLAQTSFWKMAVSLSKSDAEDFAIDGVYSCTFPENNQTNLTMTLEKMIEDDDNDRVICVFYCNQAPDGFNFDRCQSVKIEKFSAKGIYVPRSAITRVDGIRGVYVLRGSVVHFRKIEIVYAGWDYCLVSENAEDEGPYYALGTNELIITEGKNLFDGRILD